ncbi:MAG: hypothetical protein ACRC68_04425 [Clostridium sp.]
MGLFELDRRQLVILAVIIADQISSDYSVEEQDIITSLLAAIVENVAIGLAVAGKIEVDQAPKPE